MESEAKMAAILKAAAAAQLAAARRRASWVVEHGAVFEEGSLGAQWARGDTLDEIAARIGVSRSRAWALVQGERRAAVRLVSAVDG